MRGVKKYFQSGIILLLVLWLLGALFYLSSTEVKLGEAAKQKLQSSDNGGAFALVKAEFKGQEATLSGPVATAEDKAKAESIIGKQILLPGWFTSTINPVTAVHNHIAVDPENAPFRPRPWLIVSLFGGNQRVDGVLQSADQREVLLSAIAAKSPAPSTPLNNQLSIAVNALPATNWDATHTGIPNLTATPKLDATIIVSACDGKWSVFPATVSNAEIATALKASHTEDNEITHALAKLRSWKPPTPEELKQQADQKAAQEAADKAKADAPDKATPVPPPAPDLNPGTPALPQENPVAPQPLKP